ncbi:hypothetical protein CYLTODRAFT_402919, partial [Cylindrobasidium torrendii FP15055 ss-10]
PETTLSQASKRTTPFTRPPPIETRAIPSPDDFFLPPAIALVLLLLFWAQHPIDAVDWSLKVALKGIPTRRRFNLFFLSKRNPTPTHSLQSFFFLRSSQPGPPHRIHFPNTTVTTGRHSFAAHPP